MERIQPGGTQLRAADKATESLKAGVLPGGRVVWEWRWLAMALAEAGITRAQSIRIKPDIQKRPLDLQRSETGVWGARSSHGQDQQRTEKPQERRREQSLEQLGVRSFVSLVAEPLPPRLDISIIVQGDH